MVFYGPRQGFIALMTIDNGHLYRQSWHVCMQGGKWYGV